MNCFNGVGNLTHDPETRVTQSGIDETKFTIAINRPKTQDGESIADFIPIKAYKNKAAMCAQYLKKGRKVAVTGKIHTYTYEKEGVRKSGFEVVLDEITFLPSSNPDRTNLGDVHSDIYGAAHYDLNEEKINEHFTVVDIPDEELPF